MKICYKSLVACALLAFASSSKATIYGDNLGEGPLIGAGGGILDITSVEVNNTATDLIFKINLAGDPTVTDWGKYMISLDTAPGGDPAGNGWGRPIGMASGMDYWVGSWADFGNGVELRNWTGAWGLQSASYGPNTDNLVFSKNTSSVTIQFSYAGLGLAPGSTFLFDVYSSGGGGTDSAVDALGNPGVTIANWGDYYNSGLLVNAYTVPEPTALGLLFGGGALLIVNTFRRKS